MHPKYADDSATKTHINYHDSSWRWGLQFDQAGISLGKEGARLEAVCEHISSTRQGDKRRHADLLDPGLFPY